MWGVLLLLGSGGCSIYHGTLTFPCLSHAVAMQTKCNFGSASSMMNHHGAVITLSHQLHLKSCSFNVSKMVGKWAFSSEFCGSFFSRCNAFSHQTVSCRCKLKEVKFGENAFEMLETKFASLVGPRTLSWNFACTLPAGVWIMQLRCTWNYRNWQVQDDASLRNLAHTVVWIMHLLGTFAHFTVAVWSHAIEMQSGKWVTNN